MKLFGPRNALTVMRDILVLLAMTACLAVAQQVSSPQDAHQPLDNAWWTGPLLAPSANTLPRGHVLIEPYLYDVISQGAYDSSGVRNSSPHVNGFGSLTYVNYGLANEFTAA